MKHRTAIIAIVTLHIFVQISQSTPYYKWKILEDSQTLFIDPQRKYNWFEAMQECSLRNMTLITIDTPEKSEALTALLKKNFDKHPNLWTSGHDNGGSETFIWSSTGKPLEFTNWHAGDPDNKNDLPNCLTISDSAEFEWMDFRCTTKSGVICEENRFVAGSRKDWEIKKDFIERLFAV